MRFGLLSGRLQAVGRELLKRSSTGTARSSEMAAQILEDAFRNQPTDDLLQAGRARRRALNRGTPVPSRCRS